MKNRASLILSATFILLFQSLLFGQSSDQKSPRIVISEVRVGPGFVTMGITDNINSTASIFKKLAPESEILDQDLQKFGSDYFYGVTASGLFSGSLGFRFNKKDGTEKHSPLLRLGFSFYQGQPLSNALNKETTVPYDTLFSGQTGEMIIRDSVSFHAINMQYQSTQLRFDASLIWRTNFDSHWMVYGGIGLEAGGSFNNRVIIEEDKYSYSDGNTRYNRNNHYREERFASKSAFGGAVYLPLGVDLRFGNRGFWQTINFTNEFRPGFTVTNIPELGTYVSPSLAVTFGVKVTI